MADSTIGGLAIAESLDDEALIPVEQQGKAKALPGRLIREFAERATTESVEAAQNAAQSAADSAQRAEDAATHPPEIRDGMWWIYDQATGAYINSGYSSRGEQGAQGEKGDPGEQGEPGKGLSILDFYPTEAELFAAVAAPEPGDAYGVGTEAPYDIYIYGKNTGWVNNGVMQGAKGDTGAAGEPGAAGADGAPGKSAYEIAVENGFVGTEAEWLASLKGADGADGQDGAPGANGTPGANGANGADGLSAYQAAQAGGYTGTEADFDAILASLGANGFPLPLSLGGTGKNTAPLGLYALINGATALTATGIATSDYIPVGDISAATGKKITLANLKTALGVDSSGGVVTGTYVGNQAIPTTSATLQTMQEISLGFEPKFVFVGELSLSGPPWYYYSDTDDTGDYSDVTRIMAGWAMPNYPLYGYHGSSGGSKCTILETSTTGFSVRNAREADSGSSYSETERHLLNETGATYFYFAVK